MTTIDASGNQFAYIILQATQADREARGARKDGLQEARRGFVVLAQAEKALQRDLERQQRNAETVQEIYGGAVTALGFAAGNARTDVGGMKVDFNAGQTGPAAQADASADQVQAESTDPSFEAVDEADILESADAVDTSDLTLDTSEDSKPKKDGPLKKLSPVANIAQDVVDEGFKNHDRNLATEIENAQESHPVMRKMQEALSNALKPESDEATARHELLQKIWNIVNTDSNSNT